MFWQGLAGMVRSVAIARVHDGLPLAASMDDEQVYGSVLFMHIVFIAGT